MQIVGVLMIAILLVGLYVFLWALTEWWSPLVIFFIASIITLWASVASFLIAGYW